jgi:hypothetical protein
VATANFAAIPVTSPQGDKYTYNAAGQGAEVTTSALLGGAYVASYLYESTDSGGYSSATVKPTNAGSYKFSAVLKNANGDEVGRLVDYEFVIEKKALQNINFTDFGATGREYNGSATVDVTGSITGLLAGDEGKITVAQTATLDSADAGTYLINFIISGDGLKNYSYAAANVPVVSVTISPKEIEFKIVVIPKIYDGTTAAREGTEFSVSFETLVEGEAITSTLYSVDMFNTGYSGKDAGNRTLKVVVNLNAGLTDGGTKTNNYVLETTVYEESHEIGQRELTLNGLSALSREYDGTDIITLSGSVSGMVSGEELLVYLVNSVQVSSANASAQPYSVAVGLGGSGAANYRIDTTPQEAYISKRAVTVTMTGAKNKLYDGTAAATLGVDYNLVFMGAIGSLTEGASYSVDAYYSSKDVGKNYSITVSITLLGDNETNYELSSYEIASAATLAIDPALLIVEKKGDIIFEKVYDGTDAAKLLIDGVYVDLTPEYLTRFTNVIGMAAGDSLSDIFELDPKRAPVYLAGKNAGEGLTVRVSILSKNSNYYFAVGSYLTFAGSKIIKAEAAQPENIALEYGQALPTGFVLDGIPGETVTGSAAFLGALTGNVYPEYKNGGEQTVRFTPNDQNYAVKEYVINLTVSKKQIAVVLPDAPIYKTYDGTKETPLGWLSYCAVEGLVLGDDISGLIDGLKFEFPGANAGTSGVILEFKLTDADGNYAFDVESDEIDYSAEVAGQINAKKLTIAAPAEDAVYDGTDMSERIKGKGFVYVGGLLDSEAGVVADADIIIGYIEYVDIYGNKVIIEGDGIAAFEAIRAYVYYYVPTLSYSTEAMKNYYVDTAAALTVAKAAAEFGVTRTEKTLTVDNPKGYEAEYSIDGGGTWQSAEAFEVSDYKTYSVMIRLAGEDYINYEAVQPLESEYYTSIWVPIGEGAAGAGGISLIWLIAAYAAKLKKTAGSVKAGSQATRNSMFAAEKLKALNKQQAPLRLADGRGDASTQIVTKKGRMVYGDEMDLTVSKGGNRAKSEKVYRKRSSAYDKPNVDLEVGIKIDSKTLNPVVKKDVINRTKSKW